MQQTSWITAHFYPVSLWPNEPLSALGCGLLVLDGLGDDMGHFWCRFMVFVLGFSMIGWSLGHFGCNSMVHFQGFL